MANRDCPRGFFPIEGTIMGLMKAEVDSNLATTIGAGDPIILQTGGYVARAAADSGVAIVGIAISFTDSNGKPLLYLPASTAGICHYIPVQNNVFGVQADSGTAVTIADVGATADLVVGNCSTVTGRSIYELDSSNIGTGTTVRIFGKVDSPDNTWAEHVDLIVKFVENVFDDATSI